MGDSGLPENVSAVLTLLATSFIFPTLLLMRSKRKCLAVPMAALAATVNVVLAVNGTIAANDYFGHGRRTAIAATVYALAATASSTVSTLWDLRDDAKPRKRHIIVAMVAGLVGALISAAPLIIHLAEWHHAWSPSPGILCKDKDHVACEARWAIAVALLYVCLVAQACIDLRRGRDHYWVEKLLWLGRVAGLVAFIIIIVGSFNAVGTDNQMGRLSMLTTVVAPYFDYSATSYVFNSSKEGEGDKEGGTGDGAPEEGGAEKGADAA